MGRTCNLGMPEWAGIVTLVCQNRQDLKCEVWDDVCQMITMVHQNFRVPNERCTWFSKPLHPHLLPRCLLLQSKLLLFAHFKRPTTPNASTNPTASTSHLLPRSLFRPLHPHLLLHCFTYVYPSNRFNYAPDPRHFYLPFCPPLLPCCFCPRA